MENLLEIYTTRETVKFKIGIHPRSCVTRRYVAGAGFRNRFKDSRKNQRHLREYSKFMVSTFPTRRISEILEATKNKKDRTLEWDFRQYSDVTYLGLSIHYKREAEPYPRSIYLTSRESFSFDSLWTSRNYIRPPKGWKAPNPKYSLAELKLEYHKTHFYKAWLSEREVRKRTELQDKRLRELAPHMVDLFEERGYHGQRLRAVLQRHFPRAHEAVIGYLDNRYSEQAELSAS